MAGTRRLTLREASEALGVSIEAVRKRVKRGSLQSDKGPDGRVYVYLDATPDAGGDEYQQQPNVEGSEMVEELREQVAYLREQLQREQDAHSEARKIIAGLVQRIPELQAPQQARQEPTESQDTEEDQPAPQEPAEPPQRSFWRRWFGG